MRRHTFGLRKATSPKDSPKPASFLFQLRTALGELCQSAATTLDDWVFPPLCSGCGRVDTLLCEACIQEIQPLAGRILVTGLDAFTCVGPHVGPLRTAIHDLKYNNRPALQNVLGKLLANSISKQAWSFDLIIPVPLHSTRYKQRRYNQAKILATVAAKELEKPTLPHVLQRTRNTAPQVGKTLSERLSNVQAAFAVAPTDTPHLQNCRVVLVDDVCTTGATLAACAEALRHAGASKILGATLSCAHYISRDSGR